MSGEHYNNYSIFRMTLDREALAFANTVDEKTRQEYFDPRNRDIWMDAFIDWLRKRYQQPGRIASND